MNPDEIFAGCECAHDAIMRALQIARSNDDEAVANALYLWLRQEHDLDTPHIDCRD